MKTEKVKLWLAYGILSLAGLAIAAFVAALAWVAPDEAGTIFLVMAVAGAVTWAVDVVWP